MDNEATFYLTCTIGEEKFAIPISYVQEIIEYDTITTIPNTPEYMKGIINLRGRILPIMDARLKLSLPPKKPDKKSRIIVLEIQTEEKSNFVGIIVDSTKEVIEIIDDDIENPPDYQKDSASSVLKGIVKINNETLLLLNIENSFFEKEVLKLN